MRKIFFTLLVIFLTNFTIVSANNDLFSNCSETLMSQEDLQNTNSYKESEINKFLEDNNLGIIIGDIIYSNNGDYVLVSMNNEERNIIKNNNVIYNSKSNTSDIGNYSTSPSITISKDGKHIAYTYQDGNKYCINLDNKNTCYQSKDNIYYNQFPTNLSFSNDGLNLIYSLIVGEKQSNGIVDYKNKIYINNKEMSIGENIGNYSGENETSKYISHGNINYLKFSQNGDNYTYTIILNDNGSNSISSFGIYLNGKLLGKYNVSEYYYGGTKGSFISNNDLTYAIYKKSDNKAFYYMNGKETKTIPYLLEKINGLGFITKDITNNSNVGNSFFQYNNKEYQSNYLNVFNLNFDGKNVDFVGTKNNEVFYKVSCKILLDSKENTKTNYNLTSKEKEAIKIVANKISKSGVWKKSKYLIELNQLLEKFEKGSRKYEIINGVLYELNSIGLENFGNMLNN